MDFKQIKELIKLVNDSNIGEVLIENDDASVRIRHQNYQKKSILSTGVSMPSQAVSVTPSTPVTSEKVEAKKPAVSADSNEVEEESSENLVTIKSPMIGTFYRSSTPEKPPYIKVGDHIDIGQVLCIIEAMKLFNEIESEHSGKIVKVLIDNEQPVEYDQPLFLIDPTG